MHKKCELIHKNAAAALFVWGQIDQSFKVAVTIGDLMLNWFVCLVVSDLVAVVVELADSSRIWVMN